jgi:lactate permease
MQTPSVNLVNWLLAFSPIAVVLVLMVGFRWGGKQAGPVGWIVAILVAWLRFGAGFDVLVYSQVRGILLTLYVLYIIWMALVLYRVVDEAGALDVVGQGIARLTAEPTMQLLLLAWAFSSFLQGVAGFGVTVAVTAPLLIGLGFSPVVAVASASIGHSWAVTFGSMGSSFQALMAATGLPGKELAPWSAILLGVACLGCGLAAAWTFRGGRSVRKGWPALLLMGIVMAGTQILLATTGLWNLAGFGAGLAGLAAGALVARLPRYQHLTKGAGLALRARSLGGTTVPLNPGAGGMPAVATADPGPGSEPAMAASGPGTRSNPGGSEDRPGPSLGEALAPYLLLVVVVAGAELWPWLNEVLNRIVIRIHFPEVQTSYGWITAAGTGRTISVFGHAGALLAYVSVAAYLFYRWRRYYTPGVERRIVQRTIKSAVPSSIGIASMVGFAVAMDNSGMTRVLAEGLSQIAGPVYPLVSPFIGLLGSFMTGSNTNSNVVFAAMQQETAQLLAISVAIILAVQTTGGAVGSMLAPSKVIVGCSTAGLAGKEGEVLKKSLVPGLIITGVIGILAMALILLGWS